MTDPAPPPAAAAPPAAAVCPAGFATGADGGLDRIAELSLRIYARRNRLLGQWAAERMALSPAETESYARGVVQADFEESGEEDVVRKLLGDLLLAGVEADDAEVRAAVRMCEAEARRALLGAP